MPNRKGWIILSERRANKKEPHYFLFADDPGASVVAPIEMPLGTKRARTPITQA